MGWTKIRPGQTWELAPGITVTRDARESRNFRFFGPQGEEIKPRLISGPGFRKPKPANCDRDRDREPTHHKFFPPAAVVLLAILLGGCDASRAEPVAPSVRSEPGDFCPLPDPTAPPVGSGLLSNTPRAEDIDAWRMIETTPPPASTDPRDFAPVPLPELPLPTPPSTSQEGGADASFLPGSTEEHGPMITRPPSTRRPPACLPGAVRNCSTASPSPPAPLPEAGRGETVSGAADITLRAAFETYLLPSLARTKAKKTTSSYYTSLGHWESYHRAATLETDLRGSTTSTPALGDPQNTHLDPPIYQITDELLNEFGEWLMAEDSPSPDLAIGTADKVWKNLRAILRRVGPRESRNPKAVGLLDRVPTMDPVSDLIDPDRLSIGDGAVDVTDEELSAIYAACEVATWPGDASPLQWRTYLVILAVMGPRVNDAATLKAEHLRMDAKSPVRRSTRSHEHGWLVYLPTKTKGKKRTRLIVPLPLVVRSHAEALMRHRGGRLFQWTDSRGHRFAEQWQAIVDQAGLPHVERRHMRAMANLRWSRTGVRDDLGKWVLGHAARDVNESNYTRIEPDLITAVPMLEIPTAFESRLVDGPRQTFLF